MSTVRKTTKKSRSLASSRFVRLASLGEVIFHFSDLASLWKITDANTLHTTLKRYTQQGLLHRLWRGMYALKPVEQLNPTLVGLKAVHRYAYISTETILFESGITQQRPEAITLVSGISRRFSLGGIAYACRKLDDRYLYQTVGIIEKEGVRKASSERAIADLLYFNPKTHFDAPIDWKAVTRIQEELHYPIIHNTQFYATSSPKRRKT